MSSTNKNLDYDSLFKEIDRYNELPVSNESFSEYLTRIKYHNQISNKKLADRTGLSEATVCRYLTGSAKRMTNANILALVMLKEENELWYEAIIAYFYSDEETSYSIIAKSVNVSKQTIFLRVQNGLSYLRKILSEEGYDTVDDV